VPFSRTEPNVPAYEEDPNSPFEATNQSSPTFTLGQPAQRVVVLADGANAGFSKLQINGVTSTDYDYVSNSGTITKGDNSFPIPFASNRTRIEMKHQGLSVQVSLAFARPFSGDMVSGGVNDSSGTVDTLRLSDPPGTQGSTRLRVYNLDV